MTDDLLALFGRLTPKQRQGVIRIVESEIAGEPLRKLFEGPQRICTETTYYRAKPPGWHRQERFRNALDAARAVAWSFSMENAVEEAVQRLTVSAPDAARELQRQITKGDKDSDRRDAAKAVLDRVDVKTASKGTVMSDVEQSIKFDLSGLPAEVLRAIGHEGEPEEAETGSAGRAGEEGH
jgi:hypothetical protein